MWLEFKNRTEQHVALPLAGGAGAGQRDPERVGLRWPGNGQRDRHRRAEN